MSQEKVNRYKEEKANRKQILAKEKRHKHMLQFVGIVIALALVCWLGYSVYDMATRPDTSALTINTTALDEYSVGDQVQITIVRDGRTGTAAITLEEQSHTSSES